MIFEKRRKLHFLVRFGERFIYFDKHDDSEYQQICSKHMDDSMRNFIIKITMMIIGYNAAVFGPLYAYFAHGIQAKTTDLAFTEEGSNVQFAINNIFQFLCAVHGGLIYIGIEVIVEILKNVITISPKLVGHKLKKLTIDYEERRISEFQLRAAFKDIEKQSIDTDK